MTDKPKTRNRKLITSPEDVQAEVAKLQKSQDELKADVPAHRSAGVLRAEEFMDGATAIGGRTVEQRSRKQSFQVRGPKNPGDQPIAVISPDGSVYPFSGDSRDRVHLLGIDVTYIYHRDDILKVVELNERAMREDNVDRVIQGIKIAPPPLPASNAGQQLKESLAVAFSPEMLAV